MREADCINAEGPVPTRRLELSKDGVGQRLQSFSAQLNNHLGRMYCILQRLNGGNPEVAEKAAEPRHMMDVLTHIQHKLHALETMEEQLDQLI